MKLKFEQSIEKDAICIRVLVDFNEIARYEIKGRGQSFRVFTVGNNEKHPDTFTIPLAIDYVKAHVREQLIK